MGLKYDRKALVKVASQITALSKVPAQAAKAVAERFEGLLEHQFKAGVDPHGQPWKPLSPATLKQHGPSAFNATSMAEGASVHAEGTKVVMTVPSPAEWHQETRQMLPNDGEALPESYEAAIKEAADEVLKVK